MAGFYEGLGLALGAKAERGYFVGFRRKIEEMKMER